MDEILAFGPGSVNCLSALIAGAPFVVMKVVSLTGDAWVGDEMTDDEVSELVSLLEEHIQDIKAQKTRGIAIAAVGGIRSEYRIGYRMRRGCSQTLLIGALHLLSNNLEKSLNEE